MAVAHSQSLRLRSGTTVPTDTWFHVAVSFQPDRVSRSQSTSGDILGVDHAPETGVFSLYLNGAEVATEFGYAPPVTGWLWGRGYLPGVASNWPNKWGSQLTAAEGTVEAWGRAAGNPVDGWYGLKKGLRGRFGVCVPPLLEALGLAEVTHDAKNNRMRAI
ncbi:MAG: hypothetical protein EXR77_18020 [Myxococcales bacterium]|nr:hypothetical protein [Myxococcales bacterium]